MENRNIIFPDLETFYHLERGLNYNDMPKNKEQVKINGKPEFYAVLYNSFKKAALECGYALAMHGSMHTDMDLMAMPWVEDATNPDDLVRALDDCVGATVWKEFKFKDKEIRPHGRVSYSITIMGDWQIDLSVMPLKRPRR